MKYQKEILKFKALLKANSLEVTNFESLHAICDPHYYMMEILGEELSLDEYNEFAEEYDQSLTNPENEAIRDISFLYRTASENLKKTEEEFNSECYKDNPNTNKIKRLSEKMANHAYYKSLIYECLRSAHRNS
jgi:hypothetical protein